MRSALPASLHPAPAVRLTRAGALRPVTGARDYNGGMERVPREPTGISPRVDCVFRALLGDQTHADVLLDFLNAVLQRAVPLVAVQIENPVHLPDFVGDDHTVVDVKATDASGETFHVEMQSWNHAALKERMLYGWADLYEGQLVAGSGYTSLRPVVSIWILDQNCLRGATDFHHRFVVCDPDRSVKLTSDLEIHVLELDRWRRRPDPAAPPGLLRWMRFFSEAEHWASVPPEIDNPALESAMSVLHQFQVNRNWNDAYRSRLDALRVQITQETAMKEAIEEKNAAIEERTAAIEEKERAEREVAVLRERLRAHGIDPDA